MRSLLFFSVFLFVGQWGLAQNFDFPKDWVGSYAGTMYMHYPTADRMDTVEVFFELLEVEADSVWSYVMNYSSKKFGDRAKEYQIVKPDPSKEYYFHLDEKDGIIIELILMADTFYSNFSVMGSYLTSRLERVEGGVAFEITSTKEEASLESVNDPELSTDAPEEAITVFSYAPFTVQRVFLEEVD